MRCVKYPDCSNSAFTSSNLLPIALIEPRPGMLASRPRLVAIAPLPVSRFYNTVAPKVHNNISRNPLFCYFTSLLIVSPTPFVFMTSFISKRNTVISFAKISNSAIIS